MPIRPFDLLQILGAGLEVVWVCLVAPLVATRNVDVLVATLGFASRQQFASSSQAPTVFECNIPNNMTKSVCQRDATAKSML